MCGRTSAPGIAVTICYRLVRPSHLPPGMRSLAERGQPYDVRFKAERMKSAVWGSGQYNAESSVNAGSHD